MSSNIDCYKILGIPETADSTQIKKAYREKVKLYHPDSYPNLSNSEKSKMEDTLNQINSAYEILSNEEKRKDYDLSRKQQQKQYDDNSYSQHSNNSTKKENEYSKTDYFNMYNNQFYNTTDNNSSKSPKDENFDEIIEIEKKIMELDRQIAMLLVQNEEFLGSIYRCEDERERMIRQLRQSINNNPAYIEAQKYLKKIILKDSNIATRILITKKQYNKWKQYQDYINDTNNEIMEKREIIYRESDKLINDLEDKIDDNCTLRYKKQEERSILQKKYDEHPLRTKYELHKMTNSYNNKENKKNTTQK